MNLNTDWSAKSRAFLLGPQSILMVSHPLEHLKDGKGPDLDLCIFQGILPTCEHQNSVAFRANCAHRPYLRAWKAFNLGKASSPSSPLQRVEKWIRKKRARVLVMKSKFNPLPSCKCIYIHCLLKMAKSKNKIAIIYKPTTKT